MYHGPEDACGPSGKGKAMKPRVLLLAVLVPSVAACGGVFVTDYEYQADLCVYVTDYEYQADLSVWVAEYPYQAEDLDEAWFFDEYEYQADVSIYYVDYEYQADLTVFFVDYEYQAGWNNPGPWTERLH